MNPKIAPRNPSWSTGSALPTSNQAARRALSEFTAGPSPAPALTIHLSPGTPAMAAVWIILAKTRFPAELIQSSAAHGVEIASVPFDIAAEFLPDVLHQADRRLGKLSAGEPPERVEFSQIVHRSPMMRRLLQRAAKVALRSVPVLIEGESGTGKELLARAIHAASPRGDHPFIAVNCAHHWPGNVRELLNTLHRAALWSEGAAITEDDLREALLLFPARQGEEVLGRPLTTGLNLEELLGDVARHYLQRAPAETRGNRTRAAELLGLPSYQTLNNWLKKYGIVD